jgi:hypothetical protein
VTSRRDFDGEKRTVVVQELFGKRRFTVMHGLLATAAGLSLLAIVHPASADVIVRLDSGTEIRAARAWREGDVVRVAFRSGTATFPAASVVAIEDDTTPPDRQPPPRDHVAAPETPRHSRTTSAVPAAARPAKGAAVPGSAAAKAGVDEQVPQVAGEDSQTKLDRLDGLSMQMHRQLSLARTQGQPQETIDALQRNVDAINEQRVRTMKKLGR